MSESSVVNESSLTDNGTAIFTQADIRRYLESQQRESTNSSSRMVDDNSIRDGIGSSSLSGRPTSMSIIAEKFQQGFSNLVPQIEEMGNIFFDYVNGPIIKNTWRYLSGVILFENERNLSELVRVLSDYGRSRGRRMFGFSVEEDHIHVIHDCAFSGGHCRDIWRKQVEPFGQLRPTREENKPIWKFKRTDWYDVFNYFFLRKRGTRQIWIGGESWKAPSNGMYISLIH